MTTKLDEIWSDFNRRQKRFIVRRHDTHPLNIYLGCEVTGERILVLLTDV